MTHYIGNSVKTLHISVEASLKKLRTDYIDILYVHWYDFNTTIEELMNGLHYLVAARKVLYLVCTQHSLDIDVLAVRTIFSVGNFRFTCMGSLAS